MKGLGQGDTGMELLHLGSLPELAPREQAHRMDDAEE